MLQDALVRNIEVVGEAVKNLSQEITDAYPQIAWSQIAHHYFRINLDVVWKTVTDDLPALRPQITAIYENLDE